MGGDQVVKLSDHIAAKFGLGVCASEATMQEFAYNTVDRNIVRIPKGYRYLESKKRDPHGYLFMEYIPGQNLQDIDLEVRKDIDLTPHLLVLCHGDICRRNIILADDGSICFLDWAYSGFYPRSFELATITCACMEKQEQTSEEEEAYEATLFESVYGKDWKAIIAKIRGLSGLTTDTSHTVGPQPEGNEETRQPDAGKGEEDLLGISHIDAPQTEGNENTVRSDARKSENIIDTSHIGVHEGEWNVHTEQSDTGKDEDLREHDAKQIA
ncbi:hypothetical protein N7536_002393 [Penicillium majusculum]|nr:hypothetical protein N7536_002393 [Penicillium majusculum]